MVLLLILVSLQGDKIMKLPVNYDSIDQRQRRAVREEYIRLQQNKCCHCGQPLDGEPSKEVSSKTIDKRWFPPNFFEHPVHLHHNHDTGLAIGAVHNYCNAVLWQYHGK